LKKSVESMLRVERPLGKRLCVATLRGATHTHGVRVEEKHRKYSSLASHAEKRPCVLFA